MNINKAIEHFKWRFKNHWKPTKKDLEAYNSIIEYKEYQEANNMLKNQSLAKLWIYTLMSLNRTEMYSAERSIQVIDEILDNSVYEHCKDLHKNIKMLNWNAVLGKYRAYKDAMINNNISKLNEVAQDILNDKESELWESLEKDIKEENIIKFVEQHITRIIDKYEKNGVC